MLLLTTEEFIRRAIIIHGDKYDYSKSIYINYRTPLIIICPIHGEFLQLPKNHLHGRYGCKKCGDLKPNRDIDRKHILPLRKDRHTEGTYIDLANKIHNGFYIYHDIGFKDMRSYIFVTCPTHGKFRVRADGHLKYICKECSIEKNKRTTVEFIEISKKLYPGMATYDNTFYKSNMDKITVTCIKHGDFEVQACHHISPNGGSFGCKQCRMSKGENKIVRYLIDNDIEFIQEYKIDGYRFEYDFYLPKYNLLIEYDGIQHFVPIKIYGGQKGFEIIKKRDKIKTKLAKKHGYSLLRIAYIFYNTTERKIYKKIQKLIAN